MNGDNIFILKWLPTKACRQLLASEKIITFGMLWDSTYATASINAIDSPVKTEDCEGHLYDRRTRYLGIQIAAPTQLSLFSFEASVYIGIKEERAWSRGMSK
ncbi:uncharacterized protein LOC125233981 [Leguminivora glycinivorella]|uniref:uncharacterized protein LOC125233981 n=1 Tax=Leguminivora glycinivorella TaxID=1035111 RepID=UPI00200F2337|nr:uncharacterized protein LOC125233981 [Leguminivora glycinivorella]